MGWDPYDVEVGFIYTYERPFVGPLVSSLAQSGDGFAMRAIIVDNASVDGVAEWENIIPETLVVRNERPLGYAPNLNRILAASSARYVLLMNTDMYFEPREQCVAKMVQFMDAHPDCGVSGCRLYHPDGTYGHPARRFQSLRTIAARRMGLSRLIPGEVESYLYLDRAPEEVIECDWLSGCFLMVRRNAYEEVGPLDERFRKYFEDVDFCLRMRQAGWQVLMNGGTFAYHLEQRASKAVFSRDGWRHIQSYFRWLRKWGFDPARHAAGREKRAA